MVKAKEAGIQRKLVGFEMNDAKVFPRAHYSISANGEKIGEVTSGTVSPVLGKGIGMGYVPIAFATTGTPIEIIVRNAAEKAIVTKPPFIHL